MSDHLAFMARQYELIEQIRTSCLGALRAGKLDPEMAYWNYRVLAGRIRRTPWVIVEELRDQ